jgi:hypothetical protein
MPDFYYNTFDGDRAQLAGVYVRLPDLHELKLS